MLRDYTKNNCIGGNSTLRMAKDWSEPTRMLTWINHRGACAINCFVRQHSFGLCGNTYVTGLPTSFACVSRCSIPGVTFPQNSITIEVACVEGSPGLFVFAQTVKRRLPHFSRGFAFPSPARSPKNTRRQLCGEMISLAIWLTYKVF